MKKNLYIGMFAAAGLLLAASCSEDGLKTSVQTDGEEAVISFSVGLESGAQTRAISDGGSVDQLVYAVYDESGETLVIEPQTQDVDGFPTTVSLSLAKSQTYNVVFWAQKSGTGYYVTSDLKAVKVNYTTTTSGDADNAESTTGALNNDDTRDAFFKTVKIEVSGSASETVELTRPFAQINVGVTKEDWDAAVASGITIAESAVTISGVANVINLLDGTVDVDDTDGFDGTVTYASAAIPTDPSTLSVTANDATTPYNWLSMSYILVNDESETGGEKTTLESLDYTFHPESGSDITLELTSVPVQRNYRTNILGRLLTGDVSFSITLDKNYGGDVKTNYIGTEAELIAAASAGGSYMLISDVELSSAVSVTVSDLTLDLNGHSITSSESFDSSSDFLIAVDEGRVLTINDESEEATGSVGAGTNYSIKVNSGGSLIINGGIFNSFVINYGTIEISGGTFKSDIYCREGTITITDGEFNGDVTCSSTDSSLPSAMTITGGTFSGSLTCSTDEYDSTATITISGGTFYNYNPVEDGDCTLAEGYQCVQIDTDPETYVVVSSSLSVVYDEETLAAAASAGGSYTVIGDITLSSPLSVTASDLIIDLNGYSISGGRIEVGSSGSLTINDGSDGFAGSVNRAVWVRGELTINGGTFNNVIQGISGTTTINDGIFNISIGNDSGSSFVIKGGIFYGGATLNCDSDEYTVVIEGGTFRGNVVCGGGTISGGTFSGTVECSGGMISGGEFTGDVTCISEYSSYTANITITGGTFSGSLTCSTDEYDSTATITISGGTFYNYEPSSDYIVSGYEVTSTTDEAGTACWVVTKSE